jgi:hypothetical protein
MSEWKFFKNLETNEIGCNMPDVRDVPKALLGREFKAMSTSIKQKRKISNKVPTDVSQGLRKQNPTNPQLIQRK